MSDQAEHPLAAPLRVVTVGAGFFSGFHVDAWLRNDQVSFVGLADLDLDKARTLLRDFGGEERQTLLGQDSGDLFAQVQPQIIDIAVPPDAHLALIEKAVQTSARAIICQKPFCGTYELARRAVEIAEAAGKLLVVHENFRFQPWYRAIKRELEAGRVGTLYQITFRLRPGDGQGAKAYLSRQPYFQKMKRFLIHETAVHWIDTFRYLMGEPSSLFADLRQLNPCIAGEDSGLFLYRFADGRRALFDGNRLADHAADNHRLTMGDCLVEGSNGAIALNGFGELTFRRRGSTVWEPVEVNSPQEGFGGDCVYALQRHVTDHLLHGSPIENEASDYLRNMEIEEAVYRSAALACAVEVAPLLARSR
ncbi:Gfo/Idh/MocA family protein [Algihabitans albus]|uniref:Gfo/Idh/MocA family protein n=1 Tax=Algihabitans albus TaxID=2164067 RepID=UPI000E5CD03E|nr:Gfo/Idh/MocA family oxidoreductase [Algihabitans albus]